MRYVNGFAKLVIKAVQERRMKMKKQNIQLLPLILLLMLCAIVNYTYLKQHYDKNIKYAEKINIVSDEKLKKADQEAKLSSEDLKLHALSALLMDSSNNRVLYEENGYDRMPMASTTKIMTCIITIENADPNDIVTISSYAAKMPDVQLKVRAGEKYYLKDLMYSLMLESHNDVAAAIAEHVGGSAEGFAVMMNKKAKSLGCDNTNFVTANGLDAKDHYTTARDLAVITSYAIKNKQFIKITNTSSHSFHDIDRKRSFNVTNKNRFLYMMRGAIGVKTGFTNGAGYCFVGAINSGEYKLISVVLGCGWPPNKNLKWTDTKELMEYGIDNYKKRQIFKEVTLDPIYVKDGQQNWESLSINGNLSLLMRPDETVRIAYDIPAIIQAPVKKGRVIGYASYYINETLYTKIPIYAVNSIERIDYLFCIKKIFRLWSLQL
jgi:D-alanyl-D-alanine carboxypeptidase (penicillin-binding protein 5/6)